MFRSSRERFNGEAVAGVLRQTVSRQTVRTQLGYWICVSLFVLGCGQDSTTPSVVSERVARADGVKAKGKTMVSPSKARVRATHVSANRLPTLTLDVRDDSERTVVTLPNSTRHQVVARWGEDGRLRYDCAQGSGVSHRGAGHRGAGHRGDEY